MEIKKKKKMEIAVRFILDKFEQNNEEPYSTSVDGISKKEIVVIPDLRDPSEMCVCVCNIYLSSKNPFKLVLLHSGL